MAASYFSLIVIGWASLGCYRLAGYMEQNTDRQMVEIGKAVASWRNHCRN
jgi:hypothetical protein